MRKIENKIKKLKSEIRNLDKDDASSKNKLELKIENYKLEIAELKNKIPETWKSQKKQKMQKETEEEYSLFAEDYRDLHFSVRKKQKKIRKIDNKIKKLKSEIRNLDKAIC